MNNLDSNVLKDMPSCDRLLEELKNLYRDYLNVQQSDKAKQELIEQQNAKRVAAELREQRQQHAKAKKETEDQLAAAAAAAAAAANAQNAAGDGGEILSDSNDSHASDVVPTQLKMEDVVLMFDDLGVSDYDLDSTSDSDNELCEYLAQDAQKHQQQQQLQQHRRRRQREQYRRTRISRIINIKKGLNSFNAKKKLAALADSGVTAEEKGAVIETENAGEAGVKGTEPNTTATGGEKAHENNSTPAGQQPPQAVAGTAAARRKSDLSTLASGAADHRQNESASGEHHHANRGASDQEASSLPLPRRLSGGIQSNENEVDESDFDYGNEFDNAGEFQESADTAGNLQADEYDWQKTKAQLLAKRTKQAARARRRRRLSATVVTTATQNNTNTAVTSASDNSKTLATEEEAVDSDTLSYNIRKLQYAADKCWSEAETGCSDEGGDGSAVTLKLFNKSMANPSSARPPLAADNRKKPGLLRLTDSALPTTTNVVLDRLGDLHEWSDGVEEDEIELNQSDSDWSEVSHENFLNDLIDDCVEECFCDAWDDYCKRYFVPKQARQYSVYDWAYKEMVKVFQWHTVPHDCGPAGTPSVDDFMRWSIEERDFYMHQPSVTIDQEPEPPQIDSWAPGCDDPLVQVPDAVRLAQQQQRLLDDTTIQHSDGAGDGLNNNLPQKN